MMEPRMTKLPLRPILFIPAYFLSLAIIGLPLLFQMEFTVYWAAAAVLFALILQLWWTYQALAFACQFVGERSGLRTQTTVKCLLFLLILFAVYAAIFPSYIRPHLSGTPFEISLGMNSPILGLAVCIAFLAVFWLSARIVCEAEEKRKVPAHGVVGTFLLFFYIIIGAPFIYGRLKRLRSGSEGMRTA